MSNYPANWRWLETAKNQDWGQYHAGPPDNSTTTESNETGKEKVTAAAPKTTTPGKADDTYNPKARDIRKYNKIKNVSTGKTNDTEAISSDIANALNKMSQFSLGDLFNTLPTALKNELKKNMPTEVFNALETSINIMGKDIIGSGSNFLSNGNIINPQTAITNMFNVLKDVKNLNDLDTALNKIVSDESIFDFANLASTLATTIETGFGNVALSFASNGSINLAIPTEIQQTINSFVSSVSTIEAGGSENFMANSAIISTLFNRVPKEAQGALKETMQKFKTVLDDVNTSAKSWTG